MWKNDDRFLALAILIKVPKIKHSKQPCNKVYCHEGYIVRFGETVEETYGYYFWQFWKLAD